MTELDNAMGEVILHEELRKEIFKAVRTEWSEELHDVLDAS